MSCHRSVVVVAALIVSSCVGLQARAAEAGAPAVESAWLKAIKENSLEAVVACYAPDAVGWFPGTAEAKGQQAIRAAYEGMLSANTVKDATLSEVQHRTEGGVSTGWGKFTITLENKETGKTSVMAGRFSEVCVKRGERWVYLVDHASAEPAAVPKPEGKQIQQRAFTHGMAPASQRNFDYLVIGSGIAGLWFALRMAEHGSVAIITKKHRAESNTNYAQGGIAAVMAQDDSLELHVRDTLAAGAGLCKEEVVRTIVREGPALVRELIAFGVKFTEQENAGGQFDLGREGGHTRRRVLHAGDITGREIERALLAAVAARPKITVFDDMLAIDLITTQKLGQPGPNRCLGCYALDEKPNVVVVFAAKTTLLATGGSGKVYLYTSNPDIASGDGVAMAYRAGASVANMEFVQFHPTCLYDPRAKTFLISEAVRGEGAILRGRDGEPFMKRYHPMADLAPRDIVARAIDAEMKKTGAEYVTLDITHKDAAFIRQRFPNIYAKCLEYGYDMTRQPLPVVPAAHYQCGGVVTNVDGETNIAGLLAAGEVGCTGLHGANRLASNSLLEAIVVAHRAAAVAARPAVEAERIALPAWESGSAADPDELVVVTHNWDEIRRLMWDYVGIVRTDKRLLRARARIQNLQREINQFYWDYKVTPDLIELRNLVLVAELIIECALQRKESRGLHYTLDYPGLLPAAADTMLRKA